MKNTTMLEQIIKYCSENGITAYELAKHIPLSQVALQGILDRKTKTPRLKNIQLIHNYLFNENNSTLKMNDKENMIGYDVRIETLKSAINELNYNSIIIKEEMNNVNEDAAVYLSEKLNENNSKIKILEERIKIIKFAKENHKE